MYFLESKHSIQLVVLSAHTREINGLPRGEPWGIEVLPRNVQGWHHHALYEVNAVKKVVSKFLCLALVCLVGSTSSPCEEEQSTIRRVEVPFKVSAGFLIVVEGRIGTFNKLRFVLDTGVTHSVVDIKLAEKLRLRCLPWRVLNFDKAVSVERTTFPDLQFGPVEVTNVPMLVADLRQFSDFARHVDALIGMDLLRLSNFTVDYHTKKILFAPLEQPALSSVVNSDQVCMTVQVQVQNHPVRLLIDTGFQGILLYEDRLLKRIPELKIEDEVEAGIGTRMLAKQGNLRGIRLAAAQEELDSRVLLIKGPPDGVIPGIDGVIGTAWLKARWINFNFATNTLRWSN
jgi:predicted aspartyl protease